MSVTDVVPLPQNLSECGCRYAPNRHAIDCAAAIAFDAVPRPEYELGRRFAAISWDYPLRVTAEVRVEVELDPVAFIAEHAEEYAAFELEHGYEDWEKPMVFLASRIEDGIDFHLGGQRRVITSDLRVEETSEHPRWTPEDTARLHADLAKRPGPGQQELL